MSNTQTFAKSPRYLRMLRTSWFWLPALVVIASQILALTVAIFTDISLKPVDYARFALYAALGGATTIPFGIWMWRNGRKTYVFVSDDGLTINDAFRPERRVSWPEIDHVLVLEDRSGRAFGLRLKTRTGATIVLRQFEKINEIIDRVETKTTVEIAKARWIDMDDPASIFAALFAAMFLTSLVSVFLIVA